MSRKTKPQPLSVRQRVPRRQRERKALLFIWIVIPLTIVTALGLIGYWSYDNYIAVWHQKIAKVNETVIDMDYFVKRLRFDWMMLGGGVELLAYLSPQVLFQIEDDELVRQAAPRFEIEVDPEEVTQHIKDLLMPPAEEGESPPEADFNKIYRRWLDQIQLSDQEYRRVVETGLLREKITEHLKEQEVPKEGEQVYLHAILVNSEEEASEIAARITDGEDFAALAQELSLDEVSGENGGDLGWVPRGIYPELDEVTFGIESGDVSEPILAGLGYYLIKVSETAENRAIDEQYREIFAASEFQEWFAAEREASTIEEYLDQGKITWAAEQVSQQR